MYIQASEDLAELEGQSQEVRFQVIAEKTIMQRVLKTYFTYMELTQTAIGQLQAASDRGKANCDWSRQQSQGISGFFAKDYTKARPLNNQAIIRIRGYSRWCLHTGTTAGFEISSSRV